MPTATAHLPDVSAYGDADLVELVALRDLDDDLGRQAFAALYAAHRPRLAKVLGPFADPDGREPQLEDLVQDTFIAVLDRAHTFVSGTYETPGDAHRHVAAWMGRIAERVALRALGAAIPDAGLDPVQLPAPDPDAPPDPVAPHHRDALRRLHHCLGQLSPNLKAAVLAVYQELPAGSSRLPDGAPARIADALGTTVQGLRARRSRAERALKACGNSGD